MPLIDEPMPVTAPMTNSAPFASARGSTPTGTLPRSECSAVAMMKTAISNSNASAGTGGGLPLLRGTRPVSPRS